MASTPKYTTLIGQSDMVMHGGEAGFDVTPLVEMTGAWMDEEFFVYRLGATLGGLAYWALGSYRRLVLSNMALAFGDVRRACEHRSENHDDRRDDAAREAQQEIAHRGRVPLKAHVEQVSALPDAQGQRVGDRGRREHR